MRTGWQGDEVVVRRPSRPRQRRLLPVVSVAVGGGAGPATAPSPSGIPRRGKRRPRGVHRRAEMLEVVHRQVERSNPSLNEPPELPLFCARAIPSRRRSALLLPSPHACAVARNTVGAYFACGACCRLTALYMRDNRNAVLRKVPVASLATGSLAVIDAVRRQLLAVDRDG